MIERRNEMRRLFIVDYREDGIPKHRCIEASVEGPATDAALITACHAKVGLDNVLDGVAEIFADMSAVELEEIVMTPKMLFLPSRNLYINFEEVKRCAEALREV